MRRAILVAVLAGCGGESGDTGGTTEATSVGATSGGVMTSTGEAPTSGSGTTSSESTGDTPTGSTGDTGGSSSGGDPCATSTLTWETFGQAFTAKWCTECHSSTNPVAMRNCAPCSVNLDTHGGVAKFATLMLFRAVNFEENGVPPMPPNAEIPLDEREMLREYLDCGAKGPETKDMALTCPDPDTVPMCFKSRPGGHFGLH